MVERRNLGNLTWEEVEKNQRVTNEKIIDIFSTLPLQQAIISLHVQSDSTRTIETKDWKC